MEQELKKCAQCCHCKLTIDFENDSRYWRCDEEDCIADPGMKCCDNFLEKQQPEPRMYEMPSKKPNNENGSKIWDERRFQLVNGMVIAYYTNPIASKEIPIKQMIKIANRIIEELKLEEGKL